MDNTPTRPGSNAIGFEPDLHRGYSMHVSGVEILHSAGARMVFGRGGWEEGGEWAEEGGGGWMG